MTVLATWYFTSPQDTFSLGQRMGKLLLPGSLILLYGELGAGKTTLAKGIARGLGVEAPVTSPTFTIVNEYMGRVPFYHMDFYRLEEPEEAYELGLEEYIHGQGITVIEWPEKVREMLPAEVLEVRLERVDAEDQNFRKAELCPFGPEYADLVEELKR